ncbi:hypothetical protein [Kistimonas asteriae]|uniref:hypothetical protein n=1 Tax=Kistimonas asteriae TaxID=517724 RepID=UPI001BA49BD3|nr:hypothetical protein [Kistimonas asteriae]
MKIELASFSGMIPKQAAYLLPQNAAVLAENCRLTNGSLRAYKTPGVVHTLPEPRGSIYLYRDAGNAHWFSFSGDVDIVPSPIAEDANNRVYMTGHTKGARWTDNVLALSGGSDYPVNTRQLGMPEPGTAPVAEIKGYPEGIDASGSIIMRGLHDDEPEGFVYWETTEDLLYTKQSNTSGDWSDGTPKSAAVNVETRFYVFTWVTESGEEGPPSMPSNSVEWEQGQVVRLNVDTTPPGVDLNISHFRVYVTRGDGYWWLCDKVDYNIGTSEQATATDIPVGQSEINDVTPTEDRREQLVSTNWMAPPADLKDITLLPGGVAAGYRGKELYFSEPYHLYAWPPEYRQTLEYEIVAIVAAGNSLIVTTTGNPYLCFGTEPTAMTLERLDASQVCSSKRSMVDMGYQAVYASPDGLVSVAGGNPQLLTRDVINPEDWRTDYKPEEVHAYLHDGKYYGFTTTDGFIFDLQTGSLTKLSLAPACGHADLENDTLFLHVGSDVAAFNQGSTLMPYRWLSREYKGQPIKLSSCRIVAESYTDLRFQLYRDGVEIMDIAVTNDKGFRLPMGLGTTWQFALSGTDTVNAITIASSMSEL